MLFSKNFTLIFSKKMKLKFGTSLHGLADYNLHISNYIYSTIKLSKNFNIFLYRIYHYFNHILLIHKLEKSKNLEFLCVVNKYYNENIKIKANNINILDISNGINNSNILPVSNINIFLYCSPGNLSSFNL